MSGLQGIMDLEDLTELHMASFVQGDNVHAEPDTISCFKVNATHNDGYRMEMTYFDNEIACDPTYDGSTALELSHSHQLHERSHGFWDAEKFDEREEDEKEVRSFLEQPIPGSDFERIKSINWKDLKLPLCNSPVGGFLGVDVFDDVTHPVESYVSSSSTSSTSSPYSSATSPLSSLPIDGPDIGLPPTTGTVIFSAMSDYSTTTEPSNQGMVNKRQGRQRKRSRKMREEDDTTEVQTCGNCGTADTPVFRRDPKTKCLLCNKCALYRRRTGRARPPLKRKSTYHKLNEQAVHEEEAARD